MICLSLVRQCCGLCIVVLSANLLIGLHAMTTVTKAPKKVEKILENANSSEILELLNNSRRIINGGKVTEQMQYMVYLKLPTSNPKYSSFAKWLCGGVIISEEYILTSAACIEDARHFYVISGTYSHVTENANHNQCIKNGARKAIWKCVPKNYAFEGHENDNIRWMNNDIAIVKLDDELDFHRRIRGCDFIPRPIAFNNISETLEKPGAAGSVAGWGSTVRYNEWISARRSDSVTPLLVATVKVIPKRMCKSRWGARYHYIIDNYMICTQDLHADLSQVCVEKYAECFEMVSGEGDSGTARRHESYEAEDVIAQGGFCENDHGGPLVVRFGHADVVVGIISACLVRARSNNCYGPFLYTSVWKNRKLIECAIMKFQRGDCNKVFRSGPSYEETVMSWDDHPDGPARSSFNSEGNNNARKSNPVKKYVGNVTEDFDKVVPFGSDMVSSRRGVVFRDIDEPDEKSKEFKPIVRTVTTERSTINKT